MSYLDVPNFYAAPAAKLRLKDYLNGARNPNRTTAVRMVWDDDSQGTSPGGEGKLVSPLFNYELWKRYGNTPESQIIGVTDVGGGSPPAGIGIRTGNVNMTAAGSTSTTRFPYYMEPVANSRVSNAVPTTGSLWLMQANWLTVDTSITDIPRTVEYIKRTGLTFRMLIPHLATQGDTIAYRCSLSATGGGAYFNANDATGTVDITDAQVADDDWQEISIPYTFGSAPTDANLLTAYPQTILVSANANQVELGPAWYSSGDKSGITCHSWAAGGKVTSDEFTDRPGWQLFGRKFNPQIVALKTGVNDAAASLTKAQFKTAMTDKLDAYQHELPDAVYILESEAPLSTLTGAQTTEWLTYADALYEIAQAYPNDVVFINTGRRLTDSHGWTVTNAQTSGFTSDGVHDALKGARLKAFEGCRGMFRAAGLEDAAAGRVRGGLTPSGGGSRLSRVR